MKPRRDMHPMTRLAIACGSAANNIRNPLFRKMAGEDSAKIPKTRGEIGGGRRGEMARAGRALLSQLPGMAPEDFDDAALRLRGYADAISSRFEVTSEVSLGDRRRSTA